MAKRLKRLFRKTPNSLLKRKDDESFWTELFDFFPDLKRHLMRDKRWIVNDAPVLKAVLQILEQKDAKLHRLIELARREITDREKNWGTPTTGGLRRTANPRDETANGALQFQENGPVWEQNYMDPYPYQPRRKPRDC